MVAKEKAIQAETGTVKFFNVAKGFGFISISDSGKDIFFHVSGLVDKVLEKDDKVTFSIEEGDRGAKAVNIKKVN